ncbi:hypothetical protein HNP02_007611 [Mycobacterium sp. AZCC_0083]|nr:hypothetical protein [Mycobacterium sp. AZCC_0083]
MDRPQILVATIHFAQNPDMAATIEIVPAIRDDDGETTPFQHGHLCAPVTDLAPNCFVVGETNHERHVGPQLAYDAAFDAMLACMDRRERLDTAITAMAANSAFTPVVTRLGCVRGVSTLTAFGLAVEIGDWQRLNGRSIGAYLGWCPPRIPRGRPVPRAGSPTPATAMAVACWSKRPGSTDPGTGQGASCGSGGRRRPRQPGHGARQPTDL